MIGLIREMVSNMRKELERRARECRVLNFKMKKAEKRADSVSYD